MRVYKFGGASVKDANGVRNVVNIIREVSEPLVVVVSAMGKMTNAFEILLDSYFFGRIDDLTNSLNGIKTFHEEIITSLFGKSGGSDGYNREIKILENRLLQPPSGEYDLEYDQIVSFGELLSTQIVNDFLLLSKVDSMWVDSRNVIKTDDVYRDANIDWKITESRVLSTFTFNGTKMYLTQGFIGGTDKTLTTTLGREGSDYTAAILGHILNAENVTIWKDVPGVLNGDPRWYPNAIKINELSYNEAIELTYYGAQVIHPKTLKPLQNKEIPLFVKSFIDPIATGTVIHSRIGISEPIPVFVLKKDQIFVTVYPKDFSFIMEEKLIDIISIFRKFRVRMNLMQISALNFSAAFDNKRVTKEILEELSKEFSVRYNENVELLTIRQYTREAINDMIKGREVLDSQTTRKVARFILK